MSFAHFLLLALAASEAQPKVVDRVLDERVETRRHDDDLDPTLRVQVANGEIVGILARARECVAERVRVRRIGSFSPRPWGLPAGIGIAVVGGGLLAAAGGLAAVATNQPPINDPFSRGELSREAAGTLAAVSGVAGTAGAAGGVLVAIFVGDELLSERTDEDKIGARRIDCAALPLAGVPVWLVVQSAAPIVATTDDAGRVAWPVPEAPPLPSGRAWARLEANAGEHEPLSVAVELPATAFLKALANADLFAFRQFAAVFPDFALPPQIEWRRLDLERAAEAAERRAAVEKAEREAADTAQAAADHDKRRAAATAAWRSAKAKTAATLEDIGERYGDDAVPGEAVEAVEKLSSQAEARRATIPQREVYERLFPGDEGPLILGAENETAYEAVALGDVIRLACDVIEGDYGARCRAAIAAGDYARTDEVRRLRADKELAAVMRKWRGLLAARTTLLRHAGTRCVEYKQWRLRGEMCVTYGEGVFQIPIGWTEFAPASPWSKCQQTDFHGSATEGLAMGTTSLISWFEIPNGGTMGVVEVRGAPRELAERLEAELGRSLFVRWKWQGLPKPKTLTGEVAVVGGQQYVSTNTWLVPEAATVQIVDGGGDVLWERRGR